MRFIHTADWHLGRKLAGQSLLTEQHEALQQLLEYVERHRPDALLISGDVYDRAVPQPDAVALLDGVLDRLHALHVPVVMIAGNHDSAERLAFLRGVLRHQDVHVTGWPAREPTPVVLRDAHGEVHIHSVPFAEPAVVRSRIDADIAPNHAAAMVACLVPIRAAWQERARHVLLAHAHVAGATAGPSTQRRVSASRHEIIPVGTFEHFHYVALGHLHEPHAVGGHLHVQYPGSLYKYAFDEPHEKRALLVDLDHAGRCTVEILPLRPGRDVRRIEGHFEQIINFPEQFGAADDYLSVTLHDRTHVEDAIYKLRQRYPNVLDVKYVAQDAPLTAQSERRDVRVHTPLDLFEDFYRDVHGKPLTSEDRELLAGLLEDSSRQDREVTV